MSCVTLQLFELTLNASDGKHTASTRVQVTVLDANDNAPEFVDLPFRSENVLVEEDRSVLTNPKLLLTVSYPSSYRPCHCVYLLACPALL